MSSSYDPCIYEFTSGHASTPQQYEDLVERERQAVERACRSGENTGGICAGDWGGNFWMRVGIQRAAIAKCQAEAEAERQKAELARRTDITRKQPKPRQPALPVIALAVSGVLIVAIASMYPTLDRFRYPTLDRFFRS
jgi:hypothetical protein